MKKNASSKLKLDKKTVSKLNSTDAAGINGGKNTIVIMTINDSWLCIQTFGAKCGGTAPDMTML
jgi:hypothetical protein